MSSVCINENGGFFVPGKAYDEANYLRYISVYNQIVEDNGACSARKLAEVNQISRSAAQRAIDFSKAGEVVIKRPGRPTVELGSCYGFTGDHHMLIYELYRENPSRPIDDYCSKIFQITGIRVSDSFISRWFSSIGPFKGRMRFTSLFPPKKFSDRNIQLTKEYIDFLLELKDHRCIVFADEKPMREADSFTTVRRDPYTGAVPANISEKANVRFRYNIFAAVTVKKDVDNNVEAVVLDMIGDSTVFLFFVARLVQIRFLCPGDIFVVDNCSIHLHGVCEYLADTLWNCYEILMLPLPPYSPELNPTELAFNTMASRIKSNRSRSELDPGSEFSEAIKNEFVNMTRKDVKQFYRKCRYNV